MDLRMTKFAIDEMFRTFADIMKNPQMTKKEVDDILLQKSSLLFEANKEIMEEERKLLLVYKP
jgi:hypothetical protein